jgi:hypothetical protein
MACYMMLNIGKKIKMFFLVLFKGYHEEKQRKKTKMPTPFVEEIFHLIMCPTYSLKVFF